MEAKEGAHKGVEKDRDEAVVEREMGARRFHPPPYYLAPPVVIGYLTGFHAMHVATVGPNIILLMTLMEHVCIHLF